MVLAIRKSQQGQPSLASPFAASIMCEIPTNEQLQKRLAELPAEARKLDLSEVAQDEPAKLPGGQ